MATPYRGPQFSLLPTKRISWQTLATSYGIELAFILLLVNIGLLFPEKLQVKQNYHLTELIPLPGREPKPLPKPKAPVVHAKLLPAVPIATPHLVVPREVRVAQPPKPEPEPEAPKVVVNNFTPPQLKQISGGARPQLIHTGEFSTGSSATPTLNVPVQRVQTGGFGDPNGVAGKSDKDRKLTVAAVGAFDLPSGPGNGNGAAGAHGKPGVIASSGFGDGMAGAGSGDRNPRSSVSTGGFGDATTAQAAAKRAVHAADTTPVEIISKPRPVYTAEARQLHIEGEVLLDVNFAASGQIRVLRVVRGLGHGLDESAERAAQQIRFNPAKRDGQPQDSDAVVHIVFAIAE